MPTPFMCHGCDKPTMNKSGVCDDCKKKSKIKKGVVDEILLGSIVQRRIFSILGVFYVDDANASVKYSMEDSQNRKENRQIRYGLSVGG